MEPVWSGGHVWRWLVWVVAPGQGWTKPVGMGCARIMTRRGSRMVKECYQQQPFKHWASPSLLFSFFLKSSPSHRMEEEEGVIIIVNKSGEAPRPYITVLSFKSWGLRRLEPIDQVLGKLCHLIHLSQVCLALTVVRSHIRTGDNCCPDQTHLPPPRIFVCL